MKWLAKLRAAIDGVFDRVFGEYPSQLTVDSTVLDLNRRRKRKGHK